MTNAVGGLGGIGMPVELADLARPAAAAPQAADEGVERRVGPNASMVTPSASLRTRPADAALAREAVDPGTEADALDGAADLDAAAARSWPLLARRAR